jgi:transcriptional regulator with XRE-family HTH domain
MAILPRRRQDGRVDLRRYPGRIIYERLRGPAGEFMRGQHSGRVHPAGHAELARCAPEVFVDRMRADPHHPGDLLGLQMLVDQPQHLALTGSQAAQRLVGIIHLHSHAAQIDTKSSRSPNSCAPSMAQAWAACPTDRTQLMVQYDILIGATFLSERGLNLPHAVDVHVGRRLREMRKAANLSQSDVASALGLSFQQVQKYERGANRMSASKLHEAARMLGVSIAAFYEGLAPADDGEGIDLKALKLTAPETSQVVQLLNRTTPKVRQQVLAIARLLVGETGLEGAARETAAAE